MAHSLVLKYSSAYNFSASTGARNNSSSSTRTSSPTRRRGKAASASAPLGVGANNSNIVKSNSKGTEQSNASPRAPGKQNNKRLYRPSTAPAHRRPLHRPKTKVQPKLIKKKIKKKMKSRKLTRSINNFAKPTASSLSLAAAKGQQPQQRGGSSPHNRSKSATLRHLVAAHRQRQDGGGAANAASDRKKSKFESRLRAKINKAKVRNLVARLSKPAAADSDVEENMAVVRRQRQQEAQRVQRKPIRFGSSTLHLEQQAEPVSATATAAIPFLDPETKNEILKVTSRQRQGLQEVGTY